MESIQNLWYNPWINHKSLVDLTGWNRVHRSNTANSKASHIIRDRQLQPQLLSETRKLSAQIMQVNLSSDKPIDQWEKLFSLWYGMKFDNMQKMKTITHLYGIIKPKENFHLQHIWRLPTADRLTTWGMNIDLQCVLCNKNNESHQHIFTDCEFSSYLWKALLFKLDLQPTAECTLRQQLSTLRQNFATKSAVQHLAYVAASTKTHHIWLERVRRRFEGKLFSVEQRTKLIEIDVRL